MSTVEKATHAEDLDLVPSTLITWLPGAYNLSSRGSDFFQKEIFTYHKMLVKTIQTDL